MVLVRVPSSLRPYASGQSVLSVELGGDAVTVEALLDHVASVHPDLERRIRDEQGELRRHVNLFAGPTNIRELGGQAAPLSEGVEVTILPAVSGG